jgi:hypothetical protein
MSEALVAALNGLSEGILKGLSIREQRLAREQEAALKTKQLAQEQTYKDRDYELSKVKVAIDAKNADNRSELLREQIDTIAKKQDLMDAQIKQGDRKLNANIADDTNRDVNAKRNQVMKLGQEEREIEEDLRFAEKRLNKYKGTDKEGQYQKEAEQLRNNLFDTQERKKQIEEDITRKSGGEKSYAVEVPGKTQIPKRAQVHIQNISSLGSVEDIRAYLVRTQGELNKDPALKKYVLDMAKSKANELKNPDRYSATEPNPQPTDR